MDLASWGGGGGGHKMNYPCSNFGWACFSVFEGQGFLSCFPRYGMFCFVLGLYSEFPEEVRSLIVHKHWSRKSGVKKLSRLIVRRILPGFFFLKRHAVKEEREREGVAFIGEGVIDGFAGGGVIDGFTGGGVIDGFARANEHSDFSCFERVLRFLRLRARMSSRIVYLCMHCVCTLMQKEKNGGGIKIHAIFKEVKRR